MLKEITHLDSINDWEPILSSITELSNIGTQNSVKLPLCFYKLYILMSLTIINSNVPCCVFEVKA